MPGAAPDDAALLGRSANGLVERNSGGSPTFYDFHPEGNVSQRLSSTGAVQSTDSYGPFACPAIGLGVAGYEAASGCNPFDGTPASALQRGADILNILLSLLGAMNDASMCGGFGACFPAGTLVQMADGTTKPIQDIQPDDIVKSRDPNTGRFMSEPVLNAYREHSSHLITLTLADGASITCTPAHPIYVDGKGFVEAGQLGIGDRIVTRAGPPDRIENIASNTASSKDGQIGEYTIYNLTVAGTHTYFVGKDAGGVWVHNGCQLELPFDDLPQGPSESIEWHHPWPKYLGGEENQPLVGLPKSYHKAIHDALDQIYPRSVGTAAYTNVPRSEIEQNLQSIYNRYPLANFPWRGAGGYFRQCGGVTMPKCVVSIKAYDGEEVPVFQRSMSLTTWHEKLHPIIDSVDFRRELGVVRLEGLKYDLDGICTRWVATYREDGTVIEVREFRESGSLVRSITAREDGSIESSITFTEEGAIKEKRDYGHIQASATSDNGFGAQLNLFHDPGC